MRIIGGTFRGRRLVTPPGERTRPPLDRQRETLFNLLGRRLAGERVLDLFAGTGSLGLEALSRGAGRAVFVEADRAAFQALAENVARLGVGEAVELLRGDALTLPARPGVLYDLIFLDPPFRMVQEAGAALRLWTRTRELAGALAPAGRLVLRLPAGFRPPPLGAALALEREREVGDSSWFIFRKKEAL